MVAVTLSMGKGDLLIVLIAVLGFLFLPLLIVGVIFLLLALFGGWIRVGMIARWTFGIFGLLFILVVAVI